MAEQTQSIVRFWNSIKFYCGHKGCDAEIKFAMREPKNHLCLFCDKCQTEFSYSQAEKAVNHLQKILVDGSADGEECNLTNMTWMQYDKISASYYRFTVLSHRNEKIKLKVEKGLIKS